MKKNSLLGKIIKKLESPEMGKYAIPTFLGLLLVCCISVVLVSKVQTVEATDGSKKTDGINTVRMSSVEYLLEFDETVSTETQENIKLYFYSTIDSVKMLHMVNMRQKIYFSNTETEVWVEDATYIHSPLNASIEELWEAMESLE